MTRSASSAAPDGTPAKRSAGRSPAPGSVKRAGIAPAGRERRARDGERAAGAAGALPTLSPPPQPASARSRAGRTTNRQAGHSWHHRADAPLRPARRHHGRRATSADAILAATEELMREIMDRNAARARRRRELHLHAHGRPRRRVPGRRGAQARLRPRAAALRPRGARAGVAADGHPRADPLLRRRGPRGRARLPRRGPPPARDLERRSSGAAAQ